MIFKAANLAVQYARAHPELKQLLTGLEALCKESGFPEPVITHVLRTRDQQEDIYWRIIFSQAKGELTEAGARNQARHRFTWHFVFCAVDLRDYIYTKEQLAVILAWLRERTKEPRYEFLYHDVGRGKHLHVGIRDNEWAKTIPIT